MAFGAWFRRNAARRGHTALAPCVATFLTRRTSHKSLRDKAMIRASPAVVRLTIVLRPRFSPGGLVSIWRPVSSQARQKNRSRALGFRVAILHR